MIPQSVLDQMTDEEIINSRVVGIVDVMHDGKIIARVCAPGHGNLDEVGPELVKEARRLAFIQYPSGVSFRGMYLNRSGEYTLYDTEQPPQTPAFVPAENQVLAIDPPKKYRRPGQ